MPVEKPLCRDVTLLQALDWTLEEVRARSPEYFEQHALRTTLPWRPEADELAEAIADAFEVEILFGADPSSLSAVDRLFESRLGGEGLEGVDPEAIAEWSHHRAESRRSERARLAGFPAPDTRRSIDNLQYHVFGEAGPALVIVNAIGMGLQYWARLIDRLASDHRIVIWELRTVDGDGRVATLDEQVADIAALVEEFADGPVHLVGWCSGPKLCLRYAAAHPERVASMVFLAGTYGDPSTETGYQKKLDKVFELLDRSPGMAATVRGMLVDSASAAAGLQEPEVLARADPELQSCLIAPYTSDESTLAYAKQIREFWSRSLDTGVAVPTLVVGAELDRIASPKLGLEVARALPRGRFVEMPAATHYLMHDRPDEVANLIRDFLAGG